jgi:hypothetical protein
MMPGNKPPYAGITVDFPPGYTSEHIERLTAQFPGIHCVLNCRCFSIEVDDDDAPMDELKSVFAWIEKNLTAGGPAAREA